MLTGVVASLGAAKLSGLLLVENGVSMPPGIYVQELWREPAIGDVVALEDPPKWRGAPYILKRVSALGGRVFCWDEKRRLHRINARWLSPVADPSIPVWTGCTIVRNGQIVLVGDYRELVQIPGTSDRSTGIG